MPGWFERLTLGDPRRGDFTREDLPDTRPQLLGATMKSRFWKLFPLNGLWLLFNFPVFVWVLLMLQALSQTLESMASVPEVSAVLGAIIPQVLSGLLVLVPLIVLGSLGRAGLVYVADTWAYDEHAWTVAGFFEGIKKHWKQALSAGAVNGIALYTLVNALFYYIVAGNDFVFRASAGFILALMLIWQLMDLYVF
ncbi:MAG: DUF624 domain-containing protein, partial [Clostridia bacterium]|nr:DUF624 domain-containing protein [Clostridia bacterium]